MKNGDEGWTITFDDATGTVWFKKPVEKGKDPLIVRALHFSNCSWIECVEDGKPEAKK